MICTTIIAQTGCTNSLANNYNPEAVLDDNSCTFGPLKRIVHEVYYTDDGTVPDYPEGYTTFRIYAELEDANDALSAVFASEDMGDTLFLGGYQGVFWNHIGGGAVGSEISPGFFDLVPASEYDSYVTLGIPDNSVSGSIQHAEYDPLDAINTALGPDTTGNHENLWMRDGAWFAMGTPDHVFGIGEFNRVLLAQITCKTQPRYALNIQVFDDGIPGQSYQYFYSPTVEFEYMSPAYHLAYPYGLCNDPLACNYEPVTYPLYADNDLCVYGDCFGCTDPLALNYDSSVWIDDDSCEYGELGCSDPLAFNYSSTAVYSPEGTCMYEDYTIVVEPYYFDDGSVDGYPDGFHTYRIYITGQDSLEFISRVYAALGETSPGFITTYGNGTIWNNPLGGVTADDINAAIFSLDPSLEYDSFLTIGKASQEEPGVVLADSSSPNEEFDDVLGIGDSELFFEAGLWLPQYNSPNGFLGADHKILIAQITSDAPICGRLSFDIQLHPDFAYPAVVKDQFFCSPELIACNDELAINPLDSPDSPTENCAYGDYTIEVETVYDDDGMIDGYPEGFSTYRIWAQVDNPADAVSRVYSEAGMPPLEITSNGTIWNTSQGIVVGTSLQASDIDDDPVIAYDSYITIGRTQSSDPGAPIVYADGIPGNAFFDTFYAGSTNLACQLGHWYTQEGAINSLANAENRILLAQVTTNGQLSGSLNLHVIRADGTT
ncbi:MAG: hypothetical protein KDC12_15645, partial [Flavobacteriales bacterium]|nr:hypothetical protein [Flavobacteriales bacterium]